MRASHRQGETADPPFEKSLPVHRSLLGGSERRSLEADCTPQKKFGWPSPLGVRLYGSLSQAAETVFECGLENVLRMSPTRSLLHLLGRGAGPVIRRFWTLTCDRETRPRATINYGPSCRVPLAVRGTT